MIVVVMGVAGSGKTTVGQELAADLGWDFYDADDFHSAANVAKMRSGVPLTESDRGPWLAALHDLVGRVIAAGRSAVLAASALRNAHRDAIAGGRAQVSFVHLTGDPALLRTRLEQRAGHYAKADLLDSQLATLEEPTDALTIDVTPPPPAIVAAIRRGLEI
jgi:gluconokinase